MDDGLERFIVGPDATIIATMEAITRGAKAIALVADEERRLLGTVTDGDLRRALLAGADLDDNVKRYMKTDAFTVNPQATRVDVLDLMRAHSIEQIPIVDVSDRLVGLHDVQDVIGGASRSNWAVIMAGGKGRRLAPLTDEVPKPMLPVAGRPILERLVLHLAGSGIRRILLSIGYLGDQIEAYFGDGSAFGCLITYLREDPAMPLSTGGALGLVDETVGLPSESVLIVNGDLMTQFSVSALIDQHVTSGATATVGVYEHKYQVPYGVISADEDGEVLSIDEKPVTSWLVNAGVYMLVPNVFRRIESGRTLSLPDLLSDLMAEGEPVHAWKVESDWLDVGRPSDLHRARTGEPAGDD